MPNLENLGDAEFRYDLSSKQSPKFRIEEIDFPYPKIQTNS
jgi:hypothetical protein